MKKNSAMLLQPESKRVLPGSAAAALKGTRDALMGELSALSSPDLLKRHALMLDEYFRRCFEVSAIGPTLRINANPYAIMALGGYGRQEQCVHSDVDLLFLFHKKIPPEAEGLIQEVVYPLWDLGLDVGYAVRTVKECLQLSKKDYEILTPLLDARFICGMSPVASYLFESIREKILVKQGKAVIGWLVESNRNRHHQYGDSSYLLEPNLKEGQGGLRDYHTLLWMARILFDLKQPRDLEYSGCLSHKEFELLRKALVFIWDVRNRLHSLMGRKWDQLLFENQIQLAEKMGYRKRNGQEPVEVFLGMLHGHMDFIKQQHLRFLYEQGLDTPAARKKKARKHPSVPDLFLEKEMLHFASPEAVLRSPRLLIQIFEESLRLKVPLSGEAGRLIQELAPLIQSGSGEVIRSFERILCTSKAFDVLKAMLNSDFLTAFIPEFKDILHRIQYDAYHLYPVDLHLLRTVDALHSLAEENADPSSDAMMAALFQEVKKRKLLFWAALLHDIGKGSSGGDHAGKGAAMARRVMEAKGYGPRDAETVYFLVQEHLLLVKTATRRDLQDEETAIFCARRIKDPERLKMLYLLTAADSMATGPKAWTGWTQALLKDLFLKTLRILETGELATREITSRVERKQVTLMEAAKTAGRESEMAALLDVLSPRYLISVPAEGILKHGALYRRLEENGCVWQVSPGKDPRTREVTLCANDRPGLFSKIAGVFTLNGIDILEAQAFTWKNGTALDIFVVKPPADLLFEAQRWERTQTNLEAALSGELDLAQALDFKLSKFRTYRIPGAKRPSRVVVDNDTSSFFTLIEVFADDFPGLLYGVSNAMYRCGLDIRVAKISTQVDQVVDVFYVRDLEGQKVDGPEQEAVIRATVEAALQHPGSRGSAPGISEAFEETVQSINQTVKGDAS